MKFIPPNSFARTLLIQDSNFTILSRSVIIFFIFIILENRFISLSIKRYTFMNYMNPQKNNVPK